MEKNETRKHLEERLAKAEEKAKKNKESLKIIKDKLKELDNHEISLSRKQQNTIKIWHGIACLDIIKKNSEFAKLVHDYLEKNVKSQYQRKLMSLTISKEKQAIPKSKNTRMSSVFGRYSPVLAEERIDLDVPFPDPPEAKEQAKAAGAKWDSQKRKWYVEKGFDLTEVEAWLPRNKDWLTYGLL